MVTRKDVAKHAAVSTATVSNVMNNKDIVSDELKERVLAAVKELDYKPNLVAKSLKTKSSMQIAVITNDIINPFFTEVVTGVESEAFTYGYTVTVLNVSDRELNVIETIYERQYDGVLVMTDNVSIQELEDTASKNIAIALFTNELVESNINNLIILKVNEYTGARDMFRYLINSGHKKIAFFSTRKLKEGLNSKDMRLRAYIDTLEEFNLTLDEELMDLKSNSSEDILSTVYKILKSENKPTAIFAGNDYLAMISIAAARSMGFNVPDDISIVGFDNISMSSFYNPKITTVDMPKRNMGIVAFRALLHKIKEKENQLITLPTKLLIRESSKKI